MRFTYPAFSPPHSPVINRFLASGFQGMDTSMDHSSPELSAVDLKLSTLKPSPSFSSLYTSGCSTSSDLVCPSLDSSSTLSSDGFTELETDLDSGDIDISPIGEPFVGGIALDSVIGSAGDLEIGDGDGDGDYAAPLDLATPRPLRMERRSYFRQLGRGGEDKYGHGEGVKVIPDGRWPAKGILGDFKVDKVDTFGRSARLGNARDKFVSRYLATHDGRETTSTLQNQNQKGATPGDACILEGESDTKDFIETRALPPTKAKRRYADLGLGLPSAWHGEPTPKADAMSTSSSFSLTLGLGPLNTTADRMQDDPSRSCKKITLTPIDAVLAFVQTPSPIEPLPSPILFADKPMPMDAHELGIRSLPGYRNGLNILAASASVGLGIRIAKDHDQQV